MPLFSDRLLLLRQSLVSPLVGLLFGAIAIPTTIAPLAALVFAGTLQAYVATGMGIALFSAAATGLVLAWRSSFAATLALPTPEEMAAVAAIAASVAEVMPPGTDEGELALCVTVAIALTSVLTGGILLALGQLRFGAAMRFLPYPVVGGTFAGLGFLLIQGAFRVLLGESPTLSIFWSILQPPALWRWLPSLLLALLLLALVRRLPRILALPLVAAGGILGFYGILLLRQIPIARVQAEGWLLGPFAASDRLWQPLNLQRLGAVSWDILLPQIPQMLAVVVVSVLSMLVVSSRIELVAARDLDLDRELRATGLGNILSGLGGGLVGSLSATSIHAYRWGASSRYAGVAAAALYVGVLVWGLPGLAFFPKPVLGALLLFFGFDLLWQWLHDTLMRLPLRNYVLVLAIAATIATLGFVPGLVVGCGITIFRFVFDYSQMHAARAVLSGATYKSRVLRSVNQERSLRDRGETVCILQLQGSLFFGTLYKLLPLLRLRLDDPDPARRRLQYVILDFQWVSSIDASAFLGFAKLRQTLGERQAVCLLAHLSPLLETRLRQGGVLVEGDGGYRCFPDLDRAVEWCEAQTMETMRWRRPRKLPVILQLKLLFNNDGDAAREFVKSLRKIQVAAGERLFSQGEAAEAIYFIESGQISILARTGDAQAPTAAAVPDDTFSQRVQTLQAGTFVGELEFLTRSPYHLAAIADSACTLYCLERQAFERMQREMPGVAFAFSNAINALLAERLTRTQQEIDRLFA